MKLRQKLAMVLASAMVVTSVPVVTMAKSTNDVTKVLTVKADAVATELVGVDSDVSRQVTKNWTGYITGKRAKILLNFGRI